MTLFMTRFIHTRIRKAHFYSYEKGKWYFVKEERFLQEFQESLEILISSDIINNHIFSIGTHHKNHQKKLLTYHQKYEKLSLY